MHEIFKGNFPRVYITLYQHGSQPISVQDLRMLYYKCVCKLAVFIKIRCYAIPTDIAIFPAKIPGAFTCITTHVINTFRAILTRHCCAIVDIDLTSFSSVTVRACAHEVIAQIVARGFIFTRIVGATIFNNLTINAVISLQTLAVISRM